MFAIPGLLALIFVEYLRPQEYFPALLGVPFLHIATGLAMLGFVLDLRLGLSRLQPAPHLVLTALFFAWNLATVLVRVPDQLLSRASPLLVPFAIYLVVAHAVQSFRILEVLCALLLGIAVVLSAIGVEQGIAPYGCHRVVLRDRGYVNVYDGRLCDGWADRRSCEEGADPGAAYACEKVGLLGTSSIAGRVRYRGTLEDPNELALALGIAIPFAFAFFDRRHSVARLVLLVVAIAGIGACAYLTRSRGGQLVFLAVLGVYFVKRFGVARGLAWGLVLAVPIIVFGGRSSGESAGSTYERTMCWWAGLHLASAFPGFGVGSGQFTDHYQQTAHNSYILAAAELGVPGLLLWTSVVYVAAKIPIQALRAEVAPVARSWALALLASMAGTIVGILFLSYAYKDVLWIYIGLTGVLYHAIRRHDPGFSVRFRAADLGLLVLIDGVLLIALVGYTTAKLGW